MNAKGPDQTQRLEFLRVLERVETMLTAKRPFGDIERVIDDSRLSDDGQAALWLLARLVDGRRKRGDGQLSWRDRRDRMHVVGG